VFLRTGWQDRNTDAEAYAGLEGDLHFPGFWLPAAQYLVDAGVVGLGIDSLGIDAGCADTSLGRHR